MSEGVTLTGYGLSVYTRAVRMALAAKGGAYKLVPCDPFEPADADALRDGLAEAPRVLGALEDIAEEGRVLVPGRVCLSGCLLWPMLDYFCRVPDGQVLLTRFPALTHWAQDIAQSLPARTTRPELPAQAEGDTL